MIKIVDHAYEPETVIQLNQAKIKRALARKEKVIVLHSEGFVHGRLAGIPGVEYKALKALPRRRDIDPKKLSAQDSELLSRLTRHQEYRMPYDRDPRGDLFIHWFYRERREDKLSMCEIFHLNMLRYFNAMDRVETIHVRCAARAEGTAAMREAIAILSSGKAKVDFKIVQQKASWEHDTIKEAAEFAIETGRFVYYAHFKGVTRIADPLFGGNVRKGYGALDIFYWSWLLYSGIFNAPADAVAIGPMLRDGINRSYSYTKNGYDISWSVLKDALYHYVGSFQGFDGHALFARMAALGLSDKKERARKIWINDPYTVEMLLSLVFPREEVSTSYIIGTIANYNLYSTKKLPFRLALFKSLYSGHDTGIYAPRRVVSKYAVLTYCYGTHRLLREPLVVDENVAYICVTDDPNFSPMKGSAWTVVYDPWPMFDGRFRHMNAKFRPFRYADAEKVLVIDSSIEITKSVMPLFEAACPGVLLKPHPQVGAIRDELPRWISLRGMPLADRARFQKMLPLVGAGLGAKVYEGDVVLWRNTPEARRFGEDILAFVEGAGEHGPFMSNQLCMSALAVLFHDIVGEFSGDLPMRKYLHNTWVEYTKWKKAP